MVPESTADSGLSSLPWRSSTLYVILSSSLIGIMGVTLITPVLPQLRSVFGVSDAQVGLVITAYTLPGVVLTPFVGLLADRVGRRRVIVPLLFVFGIAGAAITFVESFAAVLGLRFLQGIGASALIALSVTLIGDFYRGAQRNALVGFNGSIIGFGAALYPLIGGALAEIRWNAPFLFFGVGVLVGIFAAVVLEEPETDRSTDVREYLGGLRDVILLPQALVIFGALFVSLLVFYGAVQTALPLLLTDTYGLGPGQIGPLLAMVAVASALVASQYGRVSQWRSAPELLALGFVAFGASLLGIWLAPSPLLIGVSLLAFGIGFGIVIPSVDTTIIGLVSGRLRAGMMGMRTSMLRLGQTVGPVAFTFVADTAYATPVHGYRVLLVVSGTVVVLAGAVAYLYVRRVRPSDS